jgi:hypothetical protein
MARFENRSGYGVAEGGQILSIKRHEGGVLVTIADYQGGDEKREFFLSLPAQGSHFARAFMDMSNDIDTDLANFVKEQMERPRAEDQPGDHHSGPAT